MVIIKSLSPKKNVDQLIRYVLSEEKLKPVEKKQPYRQSYYVPGIKLTKEDIKYLEAEKVDAKILSELKAAKGNIKELIDSYLKVGKQNSNKPITFSHNIRSRSVEGYIKEFKKNESYRMHERANSVRAYHSVLSFSSLDSKHLNDQVLTDIGNHYISLRGENNLYVGEVHRDKEHIHLHLVMSGTQYHTGVSNRISRQQFHELKVAMQEYQREKYPQLIHSLPEHGKSLNEKRGEKIYKTDERAKDKNVLLKLLETAYTKSQSVEHFFAQLKELGHDAYFRNGKLTGIKYDGERKFRLNRLGYDEKKLQELDLKRSKEEAVLEEIANIRNRGRDLDKEKQIESNSEIPNDADGRCTDSNFDVEETDIPDADDTQEDNDKNSDQDDDTVTDDNEKMDDSIEDDTDASDN